MGATPPVISGTLGLLVFRETPAGIAIYAVERALRSRQVMYDMRLTVSVYLGQMRIAVREDTGDQARSRAIRSSIELGQGA